MKFIFLQVTTDTTTTATKAVQELHLTDLLAKGGFIMIPLLILSLLAVVLFVERYFYISKSGRLDPNFLTNIREKLLHDNIKGAIDLCRSYQFPVARLIEKGLSRMGSPIRDIEVAIENTGRVEIYKMEKNLSLLAAIAAIAPMVGFLGTVSGMIRLFFDISQAGGTIDIAVIANGIYEKMVTSATGLIIGILSKIFHTYLNNMIDRVVNKMEVTAIEFMDILYKPVS
jgi:biopolymer transport protein ExbB